MEQTNLHPRQLLDGVLNLHIAHHLCSPNDDEKILIKKLKGLVRNIKWSPEDVSVLFEALLNRFESSCGGNRSHLVTWMVQMLHCIEMNCITSRWRSKSGRTLIELVKDRPVTDNALKEILKDDTDKTLDEIIEEIQLENLNQVDEKMLEEVKDVVSSVDQELNSHGEGSQLSGLKKDLLRLCQEAKATHFRPRLTQMVSWCLMALSKTGRLIQVGTGEGKSCIVAMFAAFRAMRGEKVDIMSSSSVLAQRDLEEWKKFYDVLKISVDCNVNKQEEDLKKCYKCQVVYGTVEEFAGDWLRHHFKRMDIFGQRTFQCAIVDEADSLMLDKGHHVVYIGSDMPALQHLNPLLAFIWATVNQYSKIGVNTSVGRKYLFHQVVSEHIKEKDINEFTILQMAENTGLLPKGSTQEIRRNPSLSTAKTSGVTADKLVGFFNKVENRFQSCQFDLYSINRSGSLEELNKRPQREQKPVSLLLNGGFCQYIYPDEDSVQKAVEAEIKRSLYFTPCELNKTEDSCYVPGFLSDLVKTKLKVWIENAFKAQTMEVDHEYVQEKHGLVPVDYSCTGVVENFMKWTDGLHQFLEMKHQSKLSDMTAITNYMSNVGLLQKYKGQIYGMSGTLGQQAEIETLSEIYNGIETCQIPSFKRRKLFEVEGLVEDDESSWMKKICDVVTEQTQPTSYRGPRAVLLICETIKLAKTLHQALGDKVPNKTLYINNNMDNRAIFTKKLDAGEVIIATNLAGRGTDLQISDSVKTAGGLFVVQTFLPKNARVEDQAFGRAARQGSPGSAQLIVCSKHLSEPVQLLILRGKLLSLMENITNISFVDQDLFVMHLRQHEKSHSDEQSKEMLSVLSDILTEDSMSNIKMAKEIRDFLVAQRLSKYVEDIIPQMKKEEELFSQYLETLDHLYRSNNNKPAASDVSALNEFWGMWLLVKFKEEDSISTLNINLKEDLNKALQELKKRQSPLSNLHHYTVFGNELQEKGELSESINMYTKAIEEDQCWAAIAFYNRAFASLTQQNRHQHPECISQALEDLQKALKSVELYIEQHDITYRYATQPTPDSAMNQTNRFDKHIRARRTVLVSFKANINQAIQKLDRAKKIGAYVKVEEVLVYFLISSEYFLQLGALLMGSERGVCSRDPLQSHQLISDPSFDMFIEIKSLESMGLGNIYVLDTLLSLGSFFSKLSSTLRRALTS